MSSHRKRPSFEKIYLDLAKVLAADSEVKRSVIQRAGIKPP